MYEMHSKRTVMIQGHKVEVALGWSVSNGNLSHGCCMIDKGSDAINMLEISQDLSQENYTECLANVERCLRGLINEGARFDRFSQDETHEIGRFFADAMEAALRDLGLRDLNPEAYMSGEVTTTSATVKGRTFEFFASSVSDPYEFTLSYAVREAGTDYLIRPDLSFDRFLEDGQTEQANQEFVQILKTALKHYFPKGLDDVSLDDPELLKVARFVHASVVFASNESERMEIEENSPGM